MSKFVVLEEKANSIYIPYIGRRYSYSDNSKLNILTFIKSLDTLYGGMSELVQNDGLYFPILEAFMEVAFWCYNNNIEVYVGQIEDSNNIGYRTLYNQYAESTIEVFNWYLQLDETLFYALSTDRENITYSMLSKPRTSEVAYNKIQEKFSGISSLPLPKAKTSNTSWKYFKYYVFGSKSYDNHEKYMRDMVDEDSTYTNVQIPTLSEEDLDSDRAYMELMNRVNSAHEDDEAFFEEHETNRGIQKNIDDDGTDSSDEVDINTIDFGDYSDVSLPDGDVVVYSVVALVSEETNKPIAIRCKTSLGFYDMNLDTARSFGFKVSKLSKAIKVTYIDGIYASASERRRGKYVDDISKNKVDCKRLIDAIMHS